MRFLELSPLLLLVVSTAAAQELAPPHQKFLDEDAVYIMTDVERERFLALEDDEARDAFIESFWQVRDPIPETAANEFKEVHFARIAEANKKYREARAGWRTDRGRMHITLGEPSSVMHYPNEHDLYPLEIWYYYALDIPRFPSQLHFMFYKRNGVGEYRLFSPAFDGMRELVADRVKRGMFGFGGFIPPAARRLWDIDVIKAAESVGPGENTLSSEVVLADVRTPGFVFERTRQNLGASVRTMVSFGRDVPVDFDVHYFRGESDFADVHLSLEIAAEDVRVNQYDDVMLGRYDVIATFRREDTGDLLEEVRDTLELAIGEKNWDEAQHFPVLFQKKLALLPGPYRVEILVRDFVGRGVGTLTRTLHVPWFPEDKMSISSVIAAFKADDVTRGRERPHAFDSLSLYPRPSLVFGEGQRVLTFLEVYYPERQFAESASPEVSVHYTLKRDGMTVLDEINRYRPRADRPGTIPVLKVVSGPALIPGDYVLEAILSEPTMSYDDFASLSFKVEGPQPMGRLSTVGVDPELEPPERFFRQAHHYMAAGRYQEAATRFQVVLDYEPYHRRAMLGKARAQILGGDPIAGGDTAEQAIGREPEDVEARTLLALAQFQQGDFAASAASYRKAIELGGESTSLLNALGETELAAGDNDAAVRALARSLELEPEQPRVRQFIEEIRALRGDSR